MNVYHVDFTEQGRINAIRVTSVRMEEEAKYTFNNNNVLIDALIKADSEQEARTKAEELVLDVFNRRNK